MISHMKVFVTGGTGLVGSHVIEKLCHHGHSVRALVRDADGRRLVEGMGASAVFGSVEDAAVWSHADGTDAIVHTDKPNEWFRDSEIAARLYKNIENYELAFYGYHGYWKSPAGQSTTTTQAIFPDLNVYGTSLRGSVGKGIGNVEFGYYESADDRERKDDGG